MHTALSKDDLTAYLHAQIPASKALDISVSHCSKQRVELQASLQTNLNHKCTAFGGSLSVIGILSAWSLVYMQLRGQQNEIVIQSSHTDYLKPVSDNFNAVSMVTDAAAWQKFHRTFTRHGRARISVASEIFCKGSLVASSQGVYVALSEAN